MAYQPVTSGLTLSTSATDIQALGVSTLGNSPNAAPANHVHFDSTDYTATDLGLVAESLPRYLAGTAIFLQTPPSGTALTVSGCTFATTTITVTVNATASLTVGQTVVIAGITGFTTNNPNGTVQVVSIVDGTHFTYVVAAAPTGAYGSGGTATPQLGSMLAIRMKCRRSATSGLRKAGLVINTLGASLGAGSFIGCYQNDGTHWSLLGTGSSDISTGGGGWGAGGAAGLITPAIGTFAVSAADLFLLFLVSGGLTMPKLTGAALASAAALNDGTWTGVAQGQYLAGTPAAFTNTLPANLDAAGITWSVTTGVPGPVYARVI